MEGLYFYKLVSPYKEDTTKDCKLTVNEIDHNFFTLKEASIVDVYLEEGTQKLVLVCKNGDKLVADMSALVPNTEFKVEYDTVNGILTLTHAGQVNVIDKLVTMDNAAETIVKYTVADGTLCGAGREDSPLGLNPMEKTSTFKAVKQVINRVKGDSLPSSKVAVKGDRYLTYEETSVFGYLYNFHDVQEIADDLTNGWRIPTKEDWDNMLNAVEMCDGDRTHDSLSCNSMLGQYAGTFLKAAYLWDGCENREEIDTLMGNEGRAEYYDDLVENDGLKEPIAPKKNPKHTKGIDKYGLGILGAGYGDGYQMMEYFGRRGKYWTNTMSHVTDVYTKRFDCDKSGVIQLAENPRSVCSLRLVKDYNGHNYTGTDSILGVTYNTSLMPSLNTSHGYTIWTSSNIAAYQQKYHPVEPQAGDSKEMRKAYFMNEWDGEEWIKKELLEGDTLVIHIGPDGDFHREYRLVHGELVNVARDIISIVMNKYDKDIHDLQNRMDLAESDIVSLREKTTALEAVDQDMWAAINKEVADRDSVDQQMWSTIATEMQAREQVDAQMWDAINAATEGRNEVDAQIWAAIKMESEAREAVDRDIWAAVNKTTEERNQVDQQMWDELINESKTREDNDNAIWADLNAEIERSVAKDDYLEGRLINQDSSSYSCEDGVLVLGTDKPENTITIQLNGNYGTF